MTILPNQTLLPVLNINPVLRHWHLIH